MRPRHGYSVWRPSPVIAIRAPEPRRSFVPRETKPMSALLPDFTIESGWRRLVGEDIAGMADEALDAERLRIVEELDRLRAEDAGPRVFLVGGIVGPVDVTDQAWLRQRWERLNADLDRRRSLGGGHDE